MLVLCPLGKFKNPSPRSVMLDLISLRRHVKSRGHPEGFAFTGFRLSPE
jgi:hypothetical protein